MISMTYFNVYTLRENRDNKKGTQKHGNITESQITGKDKGKLTGMSLEYIKNLLHLQILFMRQWSEIRLLNP